MLDEGQYDPSKGHIFVYPGWQVSGVRGFTRLSFLLSLYGQLQSHLHLLVGHLHLQSHRVWFGPGSDSDQWVVRGRLVVDVAKMSGNSTFPLVILVGLLIFKLIVNSTPELEISLRLLAAAFFVLGEHLALDLLMSRAVLL